MISAKRLSICLCLVSVFCLVALAGCGSELATIPVTGTVTLDGQPLEGATVNFAPAEKGPSARGVTDSSGKFDLTTTEPKDGAMPGTYDVGISKLDASAAGKAQADPNTKVPGGGELSGPPGRGGPPPKPKSIVPDKYTNPTRSGISVEVKEGMEPVTIELTSK